MLPSHPTAVVQNAPHMSEAQRQLQHAKGQLDLTKQYPDPIAVGLARGFTNDAEMLDCLQRGASAPEPIIAHFCRSDRAGAHLKTSHRRANFRFTKCPSQRAVQAAPATLLRVLPSARYQPVTSARATLAHALIWAARKSKIEAARNRSRAFGLLRLNQIL